MCKLTRKQVHPTIYALNLDHIPVREIDLQKYIRDVKALVDSLNSK